MTPDEILEAARDEVEAQARSPGFMAIAWLPADVMRWLELNGGNPEKAAADVRAPEHVRAWIKKMWSLEDVTDGK